jgi:hypothetical protein
VSDADSYPSSEPDAAIAKASRDDEMRS